MTRITLVIAILSAIHAPSLGQDEPYFPERAFDGQDEHRNDADARSFTKYLHAMGEPTLWKLSKDDHAVSVYRFLWLPPFDSVFAVRIVKSGKSIRV